jgi:hypothetical protein
MIEGFCVVNYASFDTCTGKPTPQHEVNNTYYYVTPQKKFLST